MSNVLKLYNNFTKSLNPVRLAGELVTPAKFNTSKQTYGSFYICGPTVYSDSHLGHAITYVRADLFRRWMKSLFNVKLITVMNITDVDDKIIESVNKQQSSFSNDTFEEGKQKQLSHDPASHPFNKLADKYYKSFLDDMAALGVLPADLSVRISRQVPLIVDFIRQLESTGNAYIVPSGDVVFRVNSIPTYKGRIDMRNAQSSGIESHAPSDHQEEALKLMRDSKTDPRDFILWKPAKANEPVWNYRSSVTNQVIPGRPGWHVQCAAIASSVFGQNLDFHYGGKDLEFPHHYNEEACCCAFHQLDASKTLHVWSKNWLHSGHLVVRDTKMSKSLGNMILIKDLIRETSVNVLRLLCIYSHYRSDLDYSQDLVDKVKACDHKLSAFSSFLKDTLKAKASETLPYWDPADPTEDFSQHDDDFDDISKDIFQTKEQILEGICNDFSLDIGLQAILDLSRRMYYQNVSDLQVQDVVAASTLLQDWCDTCGLQYGLQANTATGDSAAASADILLDLLSDFRHHVRLEALAGLKNIKGTYGGDLQMAKRSMTSLLGKCDDLRSNLDQLGIVLRDPKSSPK